MSHESKERRPSDERASQRSPCSSKSGTGTGCEGSKTSSTSSSRQSTSSPLVRIYFGGEELVVNLDDPTEMPTIFILCPHEEEELRFESRGWSQLSKFCQKHREVVIRADINFDSKSAGSDASARRNAIVNAEPANEVHIIVMEIRRKLVLSMSLQDVIMFNRDVKPVLKSRLTLPVTLGQVADACNQIPIGLYL